MENSPSDFPEIGREPYPRTTDAGRYLQFDAGGISCALPIGDVLEILPMCELITAPGLPSVLEGFLNLRGQLTPVLRIDRLFGLAAVQFQLHTHLVVVRRQAPFALLVDRVQDVIAAESGMIRETPREHVFGDCVHAVIRMDSREINLLVLDRLVLKEEETRIVELLGIAKHRLAELEKAAP